MSEIQGRKWITNSERIIGVQKGLGETWITAYQDREQWKKNNKGRISRARVRFNSVPAGTTREEAQRNLDEHAIRLGYKEYLPGGEQ